MDITERHKRFEERTRWRDLLMLPASPPWPERDELVYLMLAGWFRQHAAVEAGPYGICTGPATATALLASAWSTVFAAAFLARAGTRIADATGQAVWYRALEGKQLVAFLATHTHH